MYIKFLTQNNKSSNKFYLLLASISFSLMSVCVKKIDNRIPIYELVFFRSLFSLLITSFIINKKKLYPWGKNKTLLSLRGILGTIALLCIFYSIRNLPLNISTIIQYTYPIFISIFALVLLKEKITKNIFFAIIFGWTGIFIILNPYQLSVINVDLNIFTLLIAFLGSISTALAYITVKKLSLTEDIFIIIKYFPLISIITLSPIVFINWVTPNIDELILILGIGIFTQGGQTFLTIGLKNLPATEAASINYLQVFFASLWGVLFFNELININFIIGSILVLLATIINTSEMSKKN